MSDIPAVLLLLALAVMVAGTLYKVVRYARTPNPLKIPTTPAPLTRGGVVWRMVREVVLFQSLFKASRWTWVLGWSFHAALLLVLLGHLRLVTQWIWPHLLHVHVAGRYAAAAMMLGLAGLWLRRIAVDRVRYISSPSDHLMLALLISIGASGMALRHLAPTDVGAVQRFGVGLWQLEWHSLPGDMLLTAHVCLVATLLLIYPFSKLLHAPGMLFSPTINQADDARERHHQNPWGH